jgi:hypothetical protein
MVTCSVPVRAPRTAARREVPGIDGKPDRTYLYVKGMESPVTPLVLMTPAS